MLFLILASLTILSLKSSANIRLPRLVSDSMVLQRGVHARIWGWADPGERITVRFLGKHYRAIGGLDGRWALMLPPLHAGGPYSMELQGKNRIIIRDILVGDVWFCSGQSNMVLPMTRVRYRYPDEINGADYPQIRNFFVPTAASPLGARDTLPGGHWVAANPKTVLEFGAASYFFAKRIYLKYHVPIGLINSSVGGTLIEAWISPEGLKPFPEYERVVQRYQNKANLDSLSRLNERIREAGSARFRETDLGLTGAIPWYDTSFVPLGWHGFWLPGSWEDEGVRGLNGVIWFRKTIEVPQSMTGKPAILFLGRIVDADQTYVNGTFVGSIGYQYPPSIYSLKAGILRPGKNIIVVRVTSISGKGGFIQDKPYLLAAGKDTLDLRGDWTYQVGSVFPPPSRQGPWGGLSFQDIPSSLFNAMVAPALPYTIKGFLWYQGESNASHPSTYEGLMKALIGDWRKLWNQGELPFLYVQLPNFLEVTYSPSESGWAEIREAQRLALSVPKTAMAVTIGLGEWNDIHPLDKKDVGDRLAFAAENLAYGDSSVPYSGPLFQSATTRGDSMILSFSHTGGGLVARGGGDLKYFSISGRDRKFVWAKARIEGNQVVVWNDSIPHPVTVRYGWADNPEGANLYNRDGLPASPFQTGNP
ncbi:MAG TPA: sialate O-acetylesterase [Chitinophagaceae bacterium]|nr:sialate O-acetylesterase [Chitinophagaceae bacterium]